VLTGKIAKNKKRIGGKEEKGKKRKDHRLGEGGLYQKKLLERRKGEEERCISGNMS